MPDVGHRESMEECGLIQKPNWQSDRSLFECRKSEILEWIILSIVFLD